MKLLSAALVVLLAGCKPYFEGPESTISQNSWFINVTIHDSYAELARHPQAPKVSGTLKGFAVHGGPVCQVHYVHNDYETFVHELKHCYYGAWHD